MIPIEHMTQIKITAKVEKGPPKKANGTDKK